MVADGVQYSKARLAEYRGARASALDETTDRVEEGRARSRGDYATLPDAENAAPSRATGSEEEGDGDEDESLVE